jgi:HEAT repeat protein
MAISELRARLSAIEATENMFRGLGPSDIDDLEELLNDPEPWLAARAVHALSRIDDDRARESLRVAARSDRPEVRVAVAASAQRLSPQAADGVLLPLLGDTDPGVRKFAINAVTPANSPAVRQRLNQLAAGDSELTLRTMAERHARTLGPSE